MDLFLLLGLILTGAPRAADGHESVTVKIAQGQDVILPCSISTKDPDYFEWKKEDKDEVFFYQKGEPFGNDHAGQHKDLNGRVFHFREQLKNGNISIRITNTQKKDSGAYSCYSPQQERRCHVQLEVGVCPEPHFAALKDTNTWTLLQCKVSGVSPELQLQIKDSSGTVLHAERTESPVDQGSINMVLQTKVTKSDDYTCVATQEDICHQISSTTSVFLPGVCPKPHFAPLDQTNSRTLLQCEVHGVSPELQLELKDSSGTVLHAKRSLEPKGGGTYDMVLQTNVTKSGVYSCVVTQEDICHQISSNTSVYVHDSTSRDVVIGGLLVILFVGIVVFVIRERSRKGPSKDSSDHAADESAPMTHKS